MKIAVGQAKVVFNSGHQALAQTMKRLDVQPGPPSLLTWSRVQRSWYKEAEVFKKRRMKSRRTELAIEEARVEAEGPMQQENSEFVPKGRPVDNTREALHVLYSKLLFTLYFYAHTHTH